MIVTQFCDNSFWITLGTIRQVSWYSSRLLSSIAEGQFLPGNFQVDLVRSIIALFPLIPIFSFICSPPDKVLFISHHIRYASPLAHTLSSDLRRYPAPHHDLTLDKNLFLHPFICNRTTRFVRASLSFDASLIFGLQGKSFDMKQKFPDLITAFCSGASRPC